LLALFAVSKSDDESASQSEKYLPGFMFLGCLIIIDFECVDCFPMLLGSLVEKAASFLGLYDHFIAVRT
jgi:hypothetical protein